MKFALGILATKKQQLEIDLQLARAPISEAGLSADQVAVQAAKQLDAIKKIEDEIVDVGRVGTGESRREGIAAIKDGIHRIAFPKAGEIERLLALADSLAAPVQPARESLSQSQAQLARFYDVETKDAIIAAQESHIEKLQISIAAPA